MTRRKVVATLAIVSVLWHTVAGCCAHHAHGASVSGTAPVSHGAPSVACCHHGQASAACLDGPQGERPPPGAPHPADDCPGDDDCPCDCSGETCSFAAPETWSEPPTDGPSQRGTVDPHLAAAGRPEAADARRSRDCCASSWPTAGRLHLALGVLLR